MIDIAGKYQASIFGNLADILPSPEVISKMLKLFHDKNLLPGTFQEISPHSMGPQLRLRLSSPDNEWNVTFATHRMDVEKNPTDPKGQNLGSVEMFTNEANEFFSRILTKFKRKANRISLITSGLLREMTNDKLADIYNKLFNPIGFYQKNSPFEWNSRCAARVTFQIDDSPEHVNMITNINRVHGHFIQPNIVMDFDRIEVGFDINTIQENQETRFDIGSLNSFYLKAAKLRDKILSELEVLLDARKLPIN